MNTTGVRVEDGTIILLDSNGLPGQRFGNQYAVAGVSGDCLIAVTKHGLVEEHQIKNGNARCVRGNLGKSYDPVSIQVGSPGNFIIERANGQSDVYSNGHKTRTTGEAKIQSPSSSPVHQRSNSTSHSSSDDSVQLPTGFLNGVGTRCAQVIKDPIPGPWAMICFWLTTIIGVAVGIFAFTQTAGNIWQHYAMLAGIPIAAVAIGFGLKHALAKIFVRSWYGLPAVILGIVITNTNPDVGIWVLFAAILLWIWPIWPLLLIILVFVLTILAALGKKDKRL